MEERGVSGWREETAADLRDAAKAIELVLGALSGEPTGDQLRSVWSAYARVEKSIAFIKFDLEEENPGQFVKLRNFSVPDERQALQFALKSLKKGTDDFALGDFRQALRNLRESRNYLRALLREKRLQRARKARSA
jgi:hypothetical protein